MDSILSLAQSNMQLAGQCAIGFSVVLFLGIFLSGFFIDRLRQLSYARRKNPSRDAFDSIPAEADSPDGTIQDPEVR